MVKAQKLEIWKGQVWPCKQGIKGWRLCIFSLLYKTVTHFRFLQVAPTREKKMQISCLFWFYRYYRNFSFSRCKQKHTLLQGFSNWYLIPKACSSILYWVFPSCIWIFISFWFFLCLSLTDVTHDKIKFKGSLSC